MCGIAGIWSQSAIDERLLTRMADTLAHRGPDDRGQWIDQQAGIGLAHRRLAILDLTPAGRQPIVSGNGRYVLTFNGEIYNHRDLRAEIAGARGTNWRGHCDAETLVESIALWGLSAALDRCVGMFALGLWDRAERRLSLARDRFGEKPLYYGFIGDDFVFASELKAFAGLPGFERRIDRHSLAALAARGYIPAPRSIYEGIAKLDPASVLTLSEEDLRRRHTPAATVYWSYRTVVNEGDASPDTNEVEVLENLEAAVGRAVRQQSIADVPVGLFLSGGIDSSTVLALHCANGAGPLKTYSVSFADPRYDEGPYARAVSAHFGTEHRDFRFGAAEALDVIPRLSSIYDEPFGDPAGIPTFLLSQVARSEVTVALTGDGADELFGGYTRYRSAARLWRALALLPPWARKSAGRLLHAVPWDRLAAIPSSGPHRPAGLRLRRTLHRISTVDELSDLYRSFRDEWTGHASPVLGAGRASGTSDMDLGDGHLPDITRMMLCDSTSYLPGDLLCKTDRATMACSLEARLPFLDHRVAEAAARVPLALKVTKQSGKAILRKLLHRHAPATLFDRPKSGFTVPVGEWLRGPLKSWAEDLLSSDRLRRQGYFEAGAITGLWRDHKLRRVEAGMALWAILMFQSWIDSVPDGGGLGG